MFCFSRTVLALEGCHGRNIGPGTGGFHFTRNCFNSDCWDDPQLVAVVERVLEG